MPSRKHARQKDEEIYFAMEFAKRAGLNWLVRASSSEIDSPDLMVATPDGEFGLEHTQVFVGGRPRAEGSSLRGAEARRADRGKAILEECERTLNATLHIRFSSPVYQHEPTKTFEFDRLSNGEIADAICSLPLAAASLGENLASSQFDRCKIWVKRAHRSRWEFIQDGVGFVVTQGSMAVQAAVADKSEKLVKYRAGGLSDVRLLVIANRIRNSGKLMLPDGAEIDRLGFNRVYFFSYPDQAIEL